MVVKRLLLVKEEKNTFTTIQLDARADVQKSFKKYMHVHYPTYGLHLQGQHALFCWLLQLQ